MLVVFVIINVLHVLMLSAIPVLTTNYDVPCVPTDVPNMAHVCATCGTHVCHLWHTRVSLMAHTCATNGTHVCHKWHTRVPQVAHTCATNGTHVCHKWHTCVIHCLLRVTVNGFDFRS